MFKFLLAKRPILFAVSFVFILSFLLFFIDKTTGIFRLYNLFVYFEGHKLIGMSTMVYMMYFCISGLATVIVFAILDVEYNLTNSGGRY